MRVIEKIEQAIKEINPNAEFIIRGVSGDTATVDGVEWDDGTTPIAKADIEAKMVELQTAYDGNAYQRTRATAYEEVKEQLDQLYHDMTAGKLDATGEWHKAIKAVKDATPKP
mgnify:CR=1 FL=1